MPRKPNKTLRIAVPVVVSLIAIGVAVATAVTTSKQGSTTTEIQPTESQPADPSVALDSEQQAAADTTPAGDSPADPIAGADPDPTNPAPPDPEELVEAAVQATEDATEQVVEQAVEDLIDPAADEALAALGGAESGPTPNASPEPPADLTKFTARIVSDPSVPYIQLGALDDTADYEGALTFSPRGAGLKSLKLTRYYETIQQQEHVELQAEQSVPLSNGVTRYAVPFALLGVTIDGQFVSTSTPGSWQQDPTSPGRFEAFIDDAQGQPVVRIERVFEYEPGSFDLKLRQQAENLTDRELTISWLQTGPVDLPKPASSYGGDKRRARFGYLLSPQAQAGSATVVADTELRARTKILGERNDQDAYPFEKPLWPTPDAADNGYRLAWVAFTDRYFAIAVHHLFDTAAAQTNPELKLLEGNATVDRLVLDPYVKANDTVVVTRLTSAAQAIAAGGLASSDLGVYAGPLLKDLINADPVAASLNLEGLVVYNYGGFCGELCTFAPLTYVLLGTLRFFHDLTLDWAVSIILLVIVVRSILHPITRWSQIRVRRFGMQMQNAQPKMKKLQERYKAQDSDSTEERKRKQQKLQQEMQRLWSEEGINPANALGCLPMLLQSPVWIALWASLYFAAELRHEPAFWGVFQSLTGGSWNFLADLASPDKMIPLGPLSFKPPFIGDLYGRIESINVLPILMGIVFYIQQKYLTPTSTASLSPDQEQMQKTMRVMFPLMMPIFMYTAPAGLTVYFITNSTLGILEYKWIYYEAGKKGLLDPEKAKEAKAEKVKARGGKPGFFERLKQQAEEVQRQRAQAAGGGAGKRYVQNTAPKKDPPKRYKKR